MAPDGKSEWKIPISMRVCMYIDNKYQQLVYNIQGRKFKIEFTLLLPCRPYIRIKAK